MPNLLVITNTRAGSAGDDAVETALGVLRAGAGEVELADLDPDELPDALKRHPDHRPVVMGGDGSVHLLVATALSLGLLDRPPFTFGLVPLGTGNDFARTLGLPLDPARAAEVVLDGRPRDLDVLTDDAGGVVVNAVHLGVGAEAGRRAVPLKPRLGRLAYPVGSAVAGASTRGWPLHVTVDGELLAGGDRRSLMVALGNGATIGGGARVTPSARPDDGRVDVVVSFSTGLQARLAFAAALVRGRHPERHDVLEARGHAVTIEGGPVPLNADGELSELTGARTWTVRQHALRVTV
ncbi:diacylglycerol/lipid kinase family protein [Jiangella alkaliphila]|uniref:Diacylglycerol kinase family enzyme n=1 Tax=Jiangella alkaliphila TaxID=419479 RepID=A0A1H2KQW0_9ACTN|nr:diacylglycerol kinase family protein [Jiangella alkaliphila]SDU71023.1 Diacylglycerol kinase family enzyme [Jiangella alkaliphila]